MDQKTISRRDWLHMAGLAGLASGLPGWLPRFALSPSLDGPPGDLLVCLFLRGGLDGLAAVPPLGLPAYHDARPDLALPETGANDDQRVIQLNDQFGLHPALRPLKDLYDQGDLAIIHACGSPDPTHSHFEAMDYMERGTPGEKQLSSGWIARHLQSAYWQNDSPFRAVGIGAGLPASLRGPVPALALRSIAEHHLPGDPEAIIHLQQNLAALYELPDSDDLGEQLSASANLTMAALEALGGLDPTGYQPKQGVNYGAEPFDQALAQVAQLAKSDLGLEVACVDLGGWDTHVQQGSLEGALPALLATLARGLESFYVDMGDRMASTTVVIMSEFGRRLKQNGGGGTDHGHGNVMMALGGGIQGGAVFGDWPGLEPEALHGPGDLAITTDFRLVLSEILDRRLANPNHSQIFPDFHLDQYLELSIPRT